MKQRMYVLVTLIVVSTLFLSGCTSSSISGSKIKDITTNPEKYFGTEVTISGKVIEERFSGYMLSDGTDSILVESDTIPAIGEEVSVKGIVVKSISGIVYVDTTGRVIITKK